MALPSPTVLTPGQRSVSTEKLHWKELSLEELEEVLKAEHVSGEPEDYEYIRRDGKLHLLSNDSTVEVSLESEQVA